MFDDISVESGVDLFALSASKSGVPIKFSGSALVSKIDHVPLKRNDSSKRLDFVL